MQQRETKACEADDCDLHKDRKGQFKIKVPAAPPVDYRDFEHLLNTGAT